MKVLLVHPFPDLYGVDRMLLEVLRGFSHRGFDTLVIVPEMGPLLGALEAEGFAFRVECFPVLRKALLCRGGVAALVVGFVPKVWRLRRILSDIRPDLVYVNTLTIPHWLVAARTMMIPTLCHVHEADERYSKAMRMLLVSPLLLSKRIVAVSTATERFLSGSFGRVGKKTSVITNGIDFTALTPLAEGAGERGRLIVAGRLSSNKGQDLAIETLELLIRRGLDVELELAGSVFRGYESFERKLRYQAESAGVADRVIFSGFRHDLPRAFAEASVVLVPSRMDPLPLVPMEAMALGRPIVASRVGGLPEIVEDGISGMLVNPEDPLAMADATEKLLRDPSLRATLGHRAASSVRARFGAERFRREIAEAAESCVSRPSSSRPMIERLRGRFASHPAAP